MFVQVILNNRDSTNVPSFAIDQVGTNTVAFGGVSPRYYLKGTEIRLYNAAGALESSELLAESKSFTFEFGSWQSAAFQANSVDPTSALDLQKALDLFMAAPTNLYAKYPGTNFVGVSNAVVGFITNFNAWRDGGYVDNGNNKPPKDAVVNAQQTLANAVLKLIQTN
jgi:hypothetical protein